MPDSFVNDSTNVIEIDGNKVTSIANGVANFHVINKYGIGQKYSYLVVDYINLKAITSRKVLPKGKEVDYRIVVAPKYVTDEVVMTKPDQLVIENGIVIVLLESFTLNVSLAVIVLFSTICNSNAISDLSQLSVPLYVMLMI